MDQRLMALLDGTLDDEARLALLDEIADDPELLAQLDAASAGWVRMQALSDRARTSEAPSPARTPARRQVPVWWIPAAVAATVALVTPLSLEWGSRAAPQGEGPAAVEAASPMAFTGQPTERAPSYMLVLQGVWPDRAALSPAEVRARADEYWAYVTDLADEGVLMAAGDLRFDGGRRLGQGPVRLLEASEIGSPEHLVGILTLRVDTYEEALQLARRSPHLRYGGWVTVREVGLGFVAVPGMDDWAG